MIDAFAGLEPVGVWTHFAAFTRIARPSGQEAAVRDYIRGWTERQGGWETALDGAGNLRVRVPASPGLESVPSVILQGHLDMVCTRDADAGEYDPEQGRIRVFRATEQDGALVEDPAGDWLKADRTSLGADNGVGVAAALAVAADRSIARGPLDLLFTVEEETGLAGARRLDPALVAGRTLLNVDSEEEGILTIGSAGGRTTEILWARAPAIRPTGAAALEVALFGLLGGHSGVDINRGRLNAIRGLARVLQEAAWQVPFGIAWLRGGDRANAIPREARAVLALRPEEEPALRAALEGALSGLRSWYRAVEAGMDCRVSPVATPESAYSPVQSAVLLDLLAGIPTGVVAMSQGLPDLVETSNNLGVAATEAGGLTLSCASRSSVEEALEDVTGTLLAVAELAGARAVPGTPYPGWNPDPASSALGVAKTVYARLFAEEAETAAVHAGLECGELKGKLPHLDIVSFGPTIVGAHSTRERVHIPSVARFYRLLAGVLSELSARSDAPGGPMPVDR
jgi:dipeptidase D